MKAGIKARWVERLRSGQDEQGIGYLDYTDNSVRRKCCLGVLSAIAVEDGVIPEPNSYTYVGPKDNINTVYTYHAGHTSVLPPSVMQWSGITDCEAMFMDPESNNPQTLASLNDNGTTFEQIADIIEKNF